MLLVFTFQCILVNIYTHNFISLGLPFISVALGAIDSWIIIYKKVKENEYKSRYKLFYYIYHPWLFYSKEGHNRGFFVESTLQFSMN